MTKPREVVPVEKLQVFGYLAQGNSVWDLMEQFVPQAVINEIALEIKAMTAEEQQDLHLMGLDVLRDQMTTIGG